jgi:hypothetical protein
LENKGDVEFTSLKFDDHIYDGFDDVVSIILPIRMSMKENLADEIA